MSNKLAQLKYWADCKECKKRFYKTYDWVYKRDYFGRTLWYCCYTCFRKNAKLFDKKLKAD